MCTLNGARFLPEQLQSIAAQGHGDWALWVSDDGSTDATRAVVEAFRAEQAGRHEVRLVEGPRRGSGGQNFLSLLCREDLPVGPETHVAFCDQDDVWEPGKLERGMRRLMAVPGDGPVLYGAQSVHIDARGREVGRSRRPLRGVTLGNAVVQNMVSGHTAMLNPAALHLARAAGAHPGVAFCDWWLSLLVLAAGGRIEIDEAVVARYRQHSGNAIGAPTGLAAQARRLRMLLGRDYAGWVGGNLEALAAAPVQLTPEAREMLGRLRTGGRGLSRLATLRSLGVHRQSRLGTAALYLAAFFGRV